MLRHHTAEARPGVAASTLLNKITAPAGPTAPCKSTAVHSKFGRTKPSSYGGPSPAKARLGHAGIGDGGVPCCGALAEPTHLAP